MFFQKNVVALSNYLTVELLNPLDRLFLKQFLELTMDEQISKVQELVDKNRFDFIVKLSCMDKQFRDICLNSTFNSVWLSAWSTFGVIITGDSQRAFFAQPCKNFFDLFVGVYFYHKALTLCKNTGSLMEKDYLLIAIKYGSIHALQRYIFSVYERLDDERPNTTVAEKQIHEFITTIKAFLPFYTSYAYLMLAEAYTRYGMVKPEAAAIARQSALKACEQAKKLYKAHDPVVFNASLGLGLAASNTMNYASPEDAAAGIKRLFSPEAPELLTPVSKIRLI